MSDEFKDLDKLTTIIQESLENCLVLAKEEVEQTIQDESKDVEEIQKLLSFLLGVIPLELGDRLFIQLLNYYKTIDAEDALEFWHRYDRVVG